MAAFDYLFDAGEGTPLAVDPHHADLKVRMLFELERLEKIEGLTAGQKRANGIRQSLAKNPELAYDLAAHCTRAEAIGEDFENSRGRLSSIIAESR